MKKLSCCLLAIALCILPLFSIGCNCEGNARNVKLCEVTHSIFYAPFYVAINNGYFAEYGITLSLENAGGTDKVTAALVSGSADIGLMGPEGVIYAEEMSDNIKMFGGLTQRDGSFLVSKKDEADTFDWANLKGKHVLAGRVGGVPAMTMQYVMNSCGLYDGVDGTNIDTSVAFNMMASVFESDNSVDYTTLFEPTATEYQNAGKGYIVASVGEKSGEILYTGFTARKSYLNKNRDVAKDFLKAVVKGYKYVVENTPEVVAKSLTASFEGMSEQSLAIAVKSYIAIDAWCHSPVVTESSIVSLKKVMQNAGELDHDVPFDDIIDNSIAKEIV